MTEARDSEWRERFRASMPAEPAGACPSPETLWSAARGELAIEGSAPCPRISGPVQRAERRSRSAPSWPMRPGEPRSGARSPRRIRRVGAVATGITALAAGGS